MGGKGKQLFLGLSILSRGLLFAPVVDPLVPGGGSTPPPTNTVPAPATPPATPPVPATGGSGEPFASFATQAQFEERVSRAARAALRDKFGLEEADLTARLARAKELEDAETARKRQELTDQQRVEKDLADEKALRVKAEEAANQLRFEKTVATSSAQLGIKNVKYAQFVVAEAAEALPEGQQLDVDVYLKDLLGKDEFKSALGVAAPAVETRGTPVNTSPNPGQEPPPPPRGNGAPVDAMAMTPQQFRNHLAGIGV